MARNRSRRKESEKNKESSKMGKESEKQNM